MAKPRRDRFCRLWMVGLLGLLWLEPTPRLLPQDQRTEQDLPDPAQQFSDDRLARLRQASARWSLRTGPERTVVDQVCLVPDVPTFFEAIATWDDRHYFPILIEDTEYTLKFLRAFQPARVVRYPSRAEPLPAPERWQAARSAVGRSWVDEQAEGTQVRRADRPPDLSIEPPPGIVVSEPQAPMLPGAVALAAGRFQPLIAWRPDGQFSDKVEQPKAEQMARDLEGRVAQIHPNYQRLGDDCDFLTLALDYPYQYQADNHIFKPGPAAIDDLIGRHLDVPENKVRIRWAYTGRFLGNEVQSVYRAMCSLFLRPERATLFSKYMGGEPWKFYRISAAAERLEPSMNVIQYDGRAATLENWYQAFAPVNRSGLVMINSSGGKRGFSLRGPHGGLALDVPITNPTVVYKVHSGSAIDPSDPDSLAGRWLANGASIYFGSSHEPYLLAFRSPGLVADLLVEGLPLGAAVRLMPEELPPLANAWRLVYLGDPLFHFDPNGPDDRQPRWSATADWPRYPTPDDPPAEDAEAFDRLRWAIFVALDAAKAGEPPPQELAEVLLALDRRDLPPSQRNTRDLLLADTLFQLDKPEVVRADLGRWPFDSLSKPAQRWLQTAQVLVLQRALADDQWRLATEVWAELAHANTRIMLLQKLTERVEPSPDQSDRVAIWRRLLLANKQQFSGRRAKVLTEALQRLD